MSEIAAAGVRPAWRSKLGAGAEAARGAPDARRLLQLALAGIWLLDGVLQYQAFMFSKGFSDMICRHGVGQPGRRRQPDHLERQPRPASSRAAEHDLRHDPAAAGHRDRLAADGTRWRWPPRSPGRWACGGSARDSGWC